jgi:hypothetical protein
MRSVTRFSTQDAAARHRRRVRTAIGRQPRRARHSIRAAPRYRRNGRIVENRGDAVEAQGFRCRPDRSGWRFVPFNTNTTVSVANDAGRKREEAGSGSDLYSYWCEQAERQVGLNKRSADAHIENASTPQPGWLPGQDPHIRVDFCSLAPPVFHDCLRMDHSAGAKSPAAPPRHEQIARLHPGNALPIEQGALTTR